MDKEQALKEIMLLSAKMNQIGERNRSMTRFVHNKTMGERVNTLIRNSNSFKIECDVLDREIERNKRIIYALHRRSTKIIKHQIELAYMRMFYK